MEQLCAALLVEEVGTVCGFGSFRKRGKEGTRKKMGEVDKQNIVSGSSLKLRKQFYFSFLQNYTHNAFLVFGRHTRCQVL